MKLGSLLSAVVCAVCLLPGTMVSAKQVLAVSSSGITNNSAVPVKYTGDGADVSPSLSWSAVPQGTVSVAVSCEDPDAPSGTWWHWFVYNIPATTKALGEGLGHTPAFKDGTMQGTNDFGKTGYNGPAPPAGKVHHYIFKVFALDSKLTQVAGADKNTFNKAIAGHVLAEGQLTGTYKR